MEKVSWAYKDPPYFRDDFSGRKRGFYIQVNTLSLNILQKDAAITILYLGDLKLQIINKFNN